jgi:hypothetical protein
MTEDLVVVGGPQIACTSRRLSPVLLMKYQKSWLVAPPGRVRTLSVRILTPSISAKSNPLTVGANQNPVVWVMP